MENNIIQKRCQHLGACGIIIFFMLTFVGTIFSQVSTQWIHRYNGIGNAGDYGTDIAVDNNRNVVVAGYTWGGSSEQDYIIIKYSPEGVMLWMTTYDGPADTSDYTEDLFIDHLGNIYVTGWSYGLGSSFDFATIKYPVSGPSWVSRYNGTGNMEDIAKSLAVDSAGNVYVTGYSVGIGTSIDFATVKYNSLGVQQWVSRYNDPNSNQFDVAIHSTYKNGFLYVTGYSNKISTGYDYVTIKYNPLTGDTLWTAVYNDPTSGNDYANTVGVDNSGNVYVTGYGRITSNNDYITVKYNSSGVQQWASSYDGPATVNNSDRTFGLVLDNLNNVYVTGYSYGISTGQDWATVKYNSSGAQQWVRRVAADGSFADVPYKMITDASNNIYVTGNSAISGFSFDYFTVKYNPNGDSLWCARYNGPGNSVDIAQSIAIDLSNNVVITGYSRSTSSALSEDILTIKYSQIVGITKISSEVPNKFELYQNYPNPFNPISKIKFQISKLSEAKIIIFDALGREIQILVNEKLPPGTYETEFDGTNYPSGVYYYRLIAGDYTETKKMILIK